MINLAWYGLAENIGWHVILSNLFWWISVILVIVAYRYRRLWGVGDTTWIFLFLTFICFGIRELGHFSTSLNINSIRYIFGIWSAIFMASAFICLYIKICKRKKDNMITTYTSLSLAAISPAIMLYLYFSGDEISNLKNIMSIMESIVWLLTGSIIIYTAYMIGMHVTGRFTSVFLFFQLSAYSAFLWKLLGLVETMGSPIPYSIREIVETLFGVFAIISMYILTKMLRELSRHIYSE